MSRQSNSCLITEKTPHVQPSLSSCPRSRLIPPVVSENEFECRSRTSLSVYLIIIIINVSFILSYTNIHLYYLLSSQVSSNKLAFVSSLFQ